jgi:hypothetical protein
MSRHQLNAQRLNKFKKDWLTEEGEDIDALNNSILALFVPDSQTFLDHVLSIMKVEESLLCFYCQKKVKNFNLTPFISRQKATDKIVKEFKRRAKRRKVVIAMGSGTFSSSYKGNMPATR